MTPSQPPAVADLARREVLDLHVFFECWFRPAVATIDLDLRRCSEALAADFHQVAPDGILYPRDQLLERLQRARGSRTVDFRIEIADIDLIWEADNAVLLLYTERQYGHGLETQRRSTAFFTRSATAPGGVVWRHLQETWLQGPS